jgi:hypothetical protein
MSASSSALHHLLVLREKGQRAYGYLPDITMSEQLVTSDEVTTSGHKQSVTGRDRG